MDSSFQQGNSRWEIIQFISIGENYQQKHVNFILGPIINLFFEKTFI